MTRLVAFSVGCISSTAFIINFSSAQKCEIFQFLIWQNYIWTSFIFILGGCWRWARPERAETACGTHKTFVAAHGQCWCIIITGNAALLIGSIKNDVRPAHGVRVRPARKALPLCWYHGAPLGHFTARRGGHSASQEVFLLARLLCVVLCHVDGVDRVTIT